MSIRLSLYDFFAYTLPGGLYLLVLAYAGVIFGLINIDFQALNSLSALQIAVVIAAAYFLTFVLEPVAKRWHRLFKGGQGYTQRVYDTYKAQNPHLEFKARPGDWTVMRAYLRRNSPEIADDLERHNVSRIMMRNVSLGLALLAGLQGLECLRTNFLPLDIVLTVAFAVCSVVCGQQGATFQAWFYQGIYQAIVAESVTAADLIALKKGPEQISETAGANRKATVSSITNPVVEAIRAKFAEIGNPAEIPLIKGGTFTARLVAAGIEVNNLGTQPLLPWAVFEETVTLLTAQGGRAARGDAMGAKLGQSGLPLDSVEGNVAHIVYGKRKGDAVFRRIAPIAAILIWAGVCESAPGELVLRNL